MLYFHNELQYKELEDKALLWDVIKCDIRSRTISHSSWKAKIKREQLTTLNNNLYELEQQLNAGLQVQEEYKNAKDKLESVLDEKAQGNFIRSRAVHIEFNEKSSKYFLKQEIKNSKDKNIRCLKTVDGKTIYNPNDILNEQKSFYQKLYTINNTESCIK